MQRVPLLYLPDSAVNKLRPYLIGLGSRLASVVPGIEYDVEQSDLNVTPAEYVSRVLSNALAFFLFFFIFLFSLSVFGAGKEIRESLSISLGINAGFTLLLLVVLLRYPKIMAGKKGERINKYLVFGLKDLLLQVGAGVSLYNGLVNVSRAGYGQVSLEFEQVAKNITTGMPMNTALERMALQSNSDFLKRTTWQLINTLKAGASVKTALRTIIDDLTAEQRRKIADYARELNLWTLVYMIFAVAVPTIGSVMLVILSSFAGLGVTKGMFIAFLVLLAFVQYALIGFVKTRRPMVIV